MAIPFDGPLGDAAALFGAAAACAKYITIVEVPATIAGLIPQLGSSLILEASPQRGVGPGESVSITPYVELAGITNICSAGSAVGAGPLQDFLVRKLVHKVMTRRPIFALYQAVKNVSVSTSEQLVGVIRDAVGGVIGATGIAEYLSQIASGICAQLGARGSRLQVDSSLVSATLSPNVGTLSSASGASPLTYTCPSDPADVPEQGVTIRATLDACIGGIRGEVVAACAPLVDVSITMGDNGALLDDIFEVSIDGDSVLTSSVPVTAASTTIQLAPGTYTLRMRGHAAPDGVGTYFISVTGASLSNGPSTSGTNLVPGVTHVWTLTVAAQ